MSDRWAKAGDIVRLKSDASVWVVASVDVDRKVLGTVRCVVSGRRYQFGNCYPQQFLTSEWWDFVEDDFDRWVREVREENGSDLCSL